MTQPIPVMVRRFRCPFCVHSRASKAASVAHIARCWTNPATRACTTCSNYQPAGDGAQCVPGQPCNCNNFPHSCAAGVDLPEERSSYPVTGCLLWKSSATAATEDIERTYR